jgi:UDP-glucose 4-epimerase
MEIYAEMAYKLYQSSSIGLRFFNVYGPRQDPSSPYSGVISIFVDRLLREYPLIINGGYQTRDFIYVEDVVDIIYRSIVLSSKSDICEQVNVLTGKSATIDELADKLMKEIKISVEKNYNLLPVGDPEKSNGTTEKMVELLNVDLKQMVSLEEGLIETVRFINNNS